MADIQTSENRKTSGTKGRKKFSTRIDLTPMVDLGFLLITFFIFTTTLTKPNIMKLNLPKGEKPGMPVPESTTLNLILGEHTIGYYTGNNISHLKTTNYSVGVRNQILAMQEKISQLAQNKSQLFINIKPTTYSTYENVVDILDEMLINNVKSYVLTDATKEETIAVKS